MDNLPAVKNSNTSLFFDVDRFDHAQRVAKVFAQSTMVPEHFRNNIGNTLIAMNYADRIGADLFMCMQTMCVIHGKPGIEGKLVISLINNSGRFDPVEFEEHGDLRRPNSDDDGCVAFAKDLRSGKILRGPMVDWAMVKAEGWLGKNGSKWKTMAPLMFRYRAATYFARTYCPEVLLGMQTREELMDAVTLRKTETGEYSVETTVQLSDGTERDTSLYQPGQYSGANSRPPGNYTDGGDHTGEGQANEATPDDWDPRNNPVLNRYVAEKSARVKAVAESLGIAVTGRKPADVHADILAATQDSKKEPDADAPPPVDIDAIQKEALEMRSANSARWDAIVRAMGKQGKLKSTFIQAMSGGELIDVISEYRAVDDGAN